MGVTGKAATRQAGIGRCWRGAEVSERVVAGVGIGDDARAAPTHRHDVAQVVGEGVVEGVARRRLDAHAHHLPGQAVSRARGVVVRARWVFQFVVGKGGVDDRAVVASGQHPLAVGVIGEGRRPG